MYRAFLLALAVITTACSRHDAVVAAKPATPVRAWTVQAASAPPELRYAGTVEPLAQVTLAFRTPGIVESIHAVRGIDGRPRPLETGDCVPAGATLARIRPAEYQARTDAAQAQVSDAQASRAAAVAQVNEAQAALNQARLDWARAEKLLAGQAMTRAEADAAQARLDAARSRTEAAQAQVQALDAKVAAAGAVAAETRIGLADTRLAAPFPACVVSRHAERGAFAQPGAPAFVLADLTRVKIVFHVPDTALAALPPGTRVKAALESIGIETEAVVQSISPAADPVTRNFRIEAIAANPGRKLSAGLIAAVRLPAAAPPAAELAVPLSAVVRANGDEFAVFTIEGRTLHRQPVQLGPARGNEVVVLSGLTANQRVVREGVATLRDGEAVQVME